MSADVSETELTRFRGALADMFGWSFADADTGHLAQVLRRRAGHHGIDVRHYLSRLGSTRGTGGERDALAEELTITETYFFRHREQFDALARLVLPERIRVRGEAGQRVLRMLSVGCSSGEEPYTLAIVGRQTVPDPSWQVSVTGIDANPAMLRRAAAARYSPWSLRETPEPERRRWFRQADGQQAVDPEIRRAVRFQLHNVVDDDPVLWHHGQYDAVFCRNLLMYLNPTAATTLVGRMTRALAPGGGLFLGHTDTLGSRPHGLDPRHTAASVHYVRCPDPALTVPPVAAPAPVPVATGRIGTPPPARTGDDVRDRVVRLLRDERYADAVAVLEAAPRRPADELLYGVTLAHAGQLDAAALVCRRLLDVDGLIADVHHLLGVCLEGPGELDAAIGHYRLAAYLDPAFAMPRLRIGLLARRRGEHDVAATELERAGGLLRHETDERILFFGGGFGRVALSTLCRTELEQCGSVR